MNEKVDGDTELICFDETASLRRTISVDDDRMRSYGYVAWRVLDDGRILAVGPMLFGNGRLFVDVHADGYEDCYCYDGLARAIASMADFDPATEAEPSGWKRHPMTGRRRPGGDASQEYVAR